MRSSSFIRRSTWASLLLGLGLIAVSLVACGGPTPDAIDTDAQTEARQGAVDEAGVDAAADDGIEGVWTIDPTVGTFDDACLSDVCTSNFIGFRIDEELLGVGAKTVVGRTDAVTGTLTIADTMITTTRIDVAMRELQTDDRGRDAAMKGATGGLETQKFPDASFELTAPIELGVVPVPGESVTVDAVGDLTLHGVTRSVTFPLTAEHTDGLIVVFGTLEGVALEDYEIPRPFAPVVLGVDDVAAIELQLFFTR